MNQPTQSVSQAAASRQGVVPVHDLQTLEQALTAARTPGAQAPVRGVELCADIFSEDTIRLDGLPSGFVVFGGGYRLVARHSTPALRLAGPNDLTILDLNIRLTAMAPAVLVDTAANTTLLQNLRVQLPDGSFLAPLFSTGGFANNLVVDGLTIQQGASPTTAIELLSAGVWSACIFRRVRGRTIQLTSVANPTLSRCRFLDLDSVFELSPTAVTDSSFAQVKARVGGANLGDLGVTNTLVDFSGVWANLSTSFRQAMIATETQGGVGSRTQTNLPGALSLPPVTYNLTGLNPSINPKDSVCVLTGNATGSLTISAANALPGQLLTLVVDVNTLGGLSIPSNAGQQLAGAAALTCNQFASLTLARVSGRWNEIARSTR